MRRRTVGLAGLVLVSLGACSPMAPAGPAATATPHAVETVRLPTLMRELEGLTHERLPQALDLSQERSRRVDKVARAAGAIADSAARLRPAAGELALTDEALLAFDEYAQALERRARALSMGAQRLSPEAMREQAAAIEATCAGCHRRFRAPSPPMD